MDTIEMPGDEATLLPEQIEAVTEPVVELVETAAADAVEQLQTVAAETVATVSHETVRALDEAREELRAIAPPRFGIDAVVDPFRSIPEQVNTAMGGDASRATQALADFNAKTLTTWRANAESAFEHWRKLATAKSFSEAIALNTEFARKQIESLTAQSREFADLAGRITRDIAKTSPG